MPTYTRHVLNGVAPSGQGQFHIRRGNGGVSRANGVGHIIHICPPGVTDVLYLFEAIFTPTHTTTTYVWVSGENASYVWNGASINAAPLNVKTVASTSTPEAYARGIYPNGLTLVPGDVVYLKNFAAGGGVPDGFDGYVNRITGQ